MRSYQHLAVASVFVLIGPRICLCAEDEPQGFVLSRQLDSTTNKTVEVDPSQYTSSTSATTTKAETPMLSSKLQSYVSSFEYDGRTSDLARQYLAMYAAGYSVDQMSFASSDLPSAISSRLDDRSLDFDTMDGLLQRALVWDSGYAIGSDGSLVEILVEGGRTMGEIVVSSPEFFSTGCMALICDLDGTDFYRHLYCTGEQINSVAHCGINMPSDAVTSSMWATGGEKTDIPEMLVLGHTWTDSGNTYDVVSIHTITSANDPVYGECTKGTHHSAMAIPCVPLDSSNAHTDRVDSVSWNMATASDLVDAWLDFAAEESSSNSVTSSDSSSTIPSTASSDKSTTSDQSAVRDQSTVNDQATSSDQSQAASSSNGNGSGVVSPVSTSSFPTAVVVITGVGVLVVALIAVIIFILCRRRRSNNESRDPSPQLAPTPQITNPSPYTNYHHHSAQAFGNGKQRHSAASTRSTTYSSKRSSEHQTVDVGSLMIGLSQDPNVAGLRVQYESITFLEAISQGAFGEVSKCVYKGVTCASKKLVPSRQTLHDVELFVDEIRLTASLGHRNIIHIVGAAWHTPFDLCMLMEYFSGGDVLSFVQRNGARISWMKEKLHIAYGLAEAIAYIHTRPAPIIHRDIKARNVMLNDSLDAKLIDFGISRHYVDATMTAGVGTPFWTAPEVLLGERYSLQSDVYSFGVVLAELDREDLPYRASVSSQLGGEIGMMQVLTKIVQQGLRPDFSPTCPALVRELALGCMSREPQRRPAARELPFILRQLLDQ